MQFSPLVIGDITARVPIVQGGMGVGVSAASLAAAVARAGGVGTIASVQLGYDEPDFEKNPVEANLRALKKQIEQAKAQAEGGVIAVNIMVAVNHYEETVRAAIGAGADLIVSGAGLPVLLPAAAKGSGVKLAPIVSSGKSARVILKLWDRHNHTAPDLVVVEGPKAGGHLGFTLEELTGDTVTLERALADVLAEVKKYEEKYEKSIPVVAGGGVYDGADIAALLRMGASGVQMATRFVATEECDASPAFKQAYIDAAPDDIVIVKSPVGMPGRAIRNAFVRGAEERGETIDRCYRCLHGCNPTVAPYCISRALINSVRGNVDEGLIFCGENAGRVDRITTVRELMDELARGIEEA